jgi:hypothetical protein
MVPLVALLQAVISTLVLWVWLSLAQWLGLFMFKADDGRI